jgi:hypothetical protein
LVCYQWRAQELLLFFFFGGGGGGPTKSVKDRGQRERGSGGGSPESGVPLNLQMNETHILISLLRMYIPHGTGNSAQLWQNFGEVETSNRTPPPLTTV